MQQSLLEVPGNELLDGAHGAHRPGTERGLQRFQVKVGFGDAGAGQPVELAALDREAVLVGGQSQSGLATGGRWRRSQKRDLELALRSRDFGRIERRSS